MRLVWACVEIIRAMKGPIAPPVARRLVRQLLAEVKAEMSLDDLTALHALRPEAADIIMALYSNYTLHTFWTKWNNDEWPTPEVSNPALKPVPLRPAKVADLVSLTARCSTRTAYGSGHRPLRLSKRCPPAVYGRND